MTKPSGGTIRELRRRKGWTLEVLARRAGVSEKTLRSLEREQTKAPHPETISAVARSLGVEPEALFPSLRSHPRPVAGEPSLAPSDGQLSSIAPEPGAARAYLIVRDGQDRLLSRYPVVREQITVGRHVDNAIRLSDALVSENHAVITVLGAHQQIRDLGSTNGTYVNGQRVRGRVDIQFGDSIVVGPYHMELVAADSDPNMFPVVETGVCEPLARPPDNEEE